MGVEHRNVTIALLVFGYLIVACEAVFFIIFFVNMVNANALKDKAEAADAMTDLVFCGLHFLGTGIALSELLSRLHRDYMKDKLYDPELVTPTAVLVSFISIFVDVVGYMRSQVADSPNLIKVGTVGNVSNSAAVCAWSILTTACLFWYPRNAGTEVRPSESRRRYHV